jgi:hypothetical protein
MRTPPKPRPILPAATLPTRLEYCGRQQPSWRCFLEKETPDEQGKFDVLVLDAFSGDAIPVHLLTKEAFDHFWQHVDTETGIIAVHVTSQHVNLIPVVQALAIHFNTDSLIAYNQRQGLVYESCWVLLARQHGLLRQIPGLQQIAVIPSDGKQPVLWTDDYSNIFGLFHW